jgi:hypothetical protein
LALDAWAITRLRRLRRAGCLEGGADLVQHVLGTDLAYALPAAEDDVTDRPSAPQLLESARARSSIAPICASLAFLAAQ